MKEKTIIRFTVLEMQVTFFIIMYILYEQTEAALNSWTLTETTRLVIDVSQHGVILLVAFLWAVWNAIYLYYMDEQKPKKKTFLGILLFTFVWFLAGDFAGTFSPDYVIPITWVTSLLWVKGFDVMVDLLKDKFLKK